MKKFEVNPTCTKDDSVKDDELINLSEKFHDIVLKLQIRLPVYCTKEVYCKFIEHNQFTKIAGYKLESRVRDLLYIAKKDAMKDSMKNRFEKYFKFSCVVDSARPTLFSCKIVFDGMIFILKEPSQ